MDEVPTYGLDWVLTKSREKKEREVGCAGRIYILAGRRRLAGASGGVVGARQKDFSNTFVAGGALPGVKKA